MRGGAGVQYLIGLEIFNIQKCWDGILPFLSGDPPPHQNCARIVGSSMKKKTGKIRRYKGAPPYPYSTFKSYFLVREQKKYNFTIERKKICDSMVCVLR